MGKLSPILKKVNKALDMREAARMKRAEEMGFHENTLYHGTASKPSTTMDDGNIFDEFKLWEGEDPTRSTVRSPVSKLGVSLAEQPEVAQDFASLASQNGSDGSTVLPLRFRSENTGTIDLVGDESNEDIFGAVADSWQQGFDAIQFKNYTTPQGGKGSFVLVKDPSQIRSVNAAFDPAKKNSGDILAGLGGAGVVGGAALGSDESEAGALGKTANLALDQASRMKRAADQGFDTGATLYHGTNKDFNAFNQPINWSSPEKSLASDYAEFRGMEGGANILPLLGKKPSKSFDMDLMNKNSTPQGLIAEMGRQADFDSFPKDLQDEIFNAVDDLDLHLKKVGIDNAVMKRHHLLNSEAVGESTVEKFKDVAEKMGYDSAKLTEDGVPTIGYFNKQDIRSVSAAFDPAKRESSNLLAGLGGAGILGASMLTPEQAAAADSFAAQDNDGIYADEFPTLDRIGTLINKLNLPIVGRPLEGTANYLQRLGEPRSKWDRAKDSAGAALDLL